MEKDLDQKEGKGDENEKERTGSKTISFEEIAQVYFIIESLFIIYLFIK